MRSRVFNDVWAIAPRQEKDGWGLGVKVPEIF